MLSGSYLSQLCLEFVLGISYFGNATVKGQVGADKLIPQLLRCALQCNLCILPELDRVGPCMLRAPDVVFTEFSPCCRNWNTSKENKSTLYIIKLDSNTAWDNPRPLSWRIWAVCQQLPANMRSQPMWCKWSTSLESRIVRHQQPYISRNAWPMQQSTWLWFS